MVKAALLSLAAAIALSIGSVGCSSDSSVKFVSSDPVVQKMQEIKLKKVDIDDLTIDVAVAQIAALSKKYDAEGKGIAISIDPRIPLTTNVELEDIYDITLFDLVGRLCKDDKLSFRTTADGIVLIPASAAK